MFSPQQQKQIKAGDSSAMSVPTYHTTAHYIPEDCQDEDMEFSTAAY
jgi:hypothetical protein